MTTTTTTARHRRWATAALCLLALGVPACTDGSSPSSSPSTTASSDDGGAAALSAGAASRSILPTVDGERAYLDDAPGWPAAADLDPDDPGAFVPTWDQGRVDVGNGSEDSAWVHDDLRATAVALQRGDQRVLLVATDTYMHFSPDVDEIVRRVHDAVPEPWSDAPVLVSATHVHEGPDTAFSVNDDWYSLLADEVAAASAEAVDRLEPAAATVATSTHRYGVDDVRDPVILDPRLNVLAIDAAGGDGDRIATVVQWNSHPEVTLGWAPPLPDDELVAACEAKGWADDDCTAEGRYLTADYPGVLRTRLQAERGGEVLYLNGALGSQIGPGQAQAWVVDDDHPVTDDGVAPAGAQPLTACEDEDPLLCRSFAKTESIGTQLAEKVLAMEADAEPLDITSLDVTEEPFFTRMTNIGFRVLLADGTLGWQEPTLYTCDGPPSEDTCEEAPDRAEDDPVITPLADSQVVVGDVFRSRVARLDLGDVGFLYLPGELPPELVVGLPDDFESNVEAYYREPELHATGADYEIPGALLSLADEDVTFTVGLGTDELGYAVPIADYRLRCLDVALPTGATCADLAARDVIPSPDFIDGATCAEITDDPAALEALGGDGPAVTAICRYGQALGRELGEPDGHYEETNAVGWGFVDDLWAASQRLYGTS